MSFLAQLRQTQQAQTPAGIQLCYIWRSDMQGRVTLALYLSSVDRGHIRELGKPYVIQREHLQLPPPFLSVDDVHVLRTLLSCSDMALKQHESGVFPKNTHEFVNAVLTTQKSFVELDSGVLRPLVLKGNYLAEPVWQIDADGVQTLSWSTPENAKLWLLNGIPYGFDAERVHLVQGVGDSVARLGPRVEAQVPLEPHAVSAFITCAGSEWSERGLPLPIDIDVRTLFGELQPILVCSGDFVALGFRYVADDLCVQCLHSDSTDDISLWDGQQLLCIERHAATEEDYLAKLLPFIKGFTKSKNGRWYTEQNEAWQVLLLEQREQLESLGFTFLFERGFKHHYIAPQNWSVAVERVHPEQWQFSISFDMEKQKINVFDLLKQLIVFNQESRELQQEIIINGKTLILSSALVGSLVAELGDLIEFNQCDSPIPLSQLYRLKTLKDQLPDSTQWSGETTLLEQSINLHSSPIMLDSRCSGVKAELRPYQWLGVCWMQHLKQSGFNGLLADDMGLGKTLQTLAHLSLEKQDIDPTCHQTSLIVAPTSLLSNWASEITRFCPHLSFIVLHGNQRHSQWEDIAGKDIVITSYPLLVRDLERWQQQDIHWLVLDEAQVIKNVSTKVSQAVRALNGRHRLCLSGTPVENHLGELWSILDFLEPGVLGSERQFRSYYQRAIESDANQQRFTQLLSRIEPFMLRRTKTQVAKDLPPKTQIQKMVTLGEEQMEYYQTLKTEGWQSLSEQLEQVDNNGQKQILMLTALMRLRQVCCDPLLLRKGEAEVDTLEAVIPSAKTEYCIEMLNELVAEGRAVLVFSQFTSMLDILAKRLQDDGIEYLLLTGKSKNRAQLVDSFQQGKAAVFLISLKAGGVGLNLTRADTVIHFDPWWNQAAEEQASDRAHRIGQKNPVFVYKLIAEGTIEEKIALMQERKAVLSQQVNQQAQLSGESFALKLEDLLSLLDTAD